MEELNFDIIVVGGGPAGSSAAHIAAKNGGTVVLIEKEKEIAETVRTSGVTWISDVKKFGITDECYNPIKKFSFCSPKNSVTISDDVAKAAVLDVRKTYKFLARKAQNAGVKIFVGTNVTDVLRDSSGKCIGVIAKSQDRQIQFNGKVIIDASGFASVVAKELGYVKQWKKFGG